MSIVLIDILCLVLIAAGAAMLLKRPARPVSGAPGAGSASGTPQTYVLRIAGVMIAAFGFALGMMMTVFHFS